MQAVLDAVQTEPASFPLDLPTSILYPDFEFSPPEPGSPDSLPAFTVDNLQKADWAVAKILAAEARNTRRADLAAELHARIDTWLTKASSADQESIDYLTSILRSFAESEIAKQHRSRTLLLPSGSVSLKRMQDRLDITSPEATIAWASENAPNAIIIKKELSRSVLKALIVSQGEAIPGCEFSLGEDQLYIRNNT